MTEKKKMTKEEKIEKAKKHLEELYALRLTPEEMEQVAGGKESLVTQYGNELSAMVFDEWLDKQIQEVGITSSN